MVVLTSVDAQRGTTQLHSRQVHSIMAEVWWQNAMQLGILRNMI